MAKSKNLVSKIILGIVLCLVVSYVIFSVVIYQISKSPSSFSDFPSEGVWAATNENYSIRFDLSDGYVGNMIATLIVNNKEYDISVSIGSGHGTIFAPTAPATIMYFKADIDGQKLHFSVSKYEINEDDFYLLDIYTYEDNTFNYIKPKMNLQFFKQTADNT